jgi:hypothetical protein
VGPLARAALARPAGPILPGVMLPGGGDAPLARATVVVLAAYQVGTADAATVTLVATRGEIAGASRIADGVVALGPPALVARCAAVAAGHGDSAAGEAELIALRARAMPAGVPGASLRATARLSLDARVALAPVLGPDLAPASLSLWADVVDDAAAVAILDARDPAGGGGERTQVALERLRIALAGSTALLQLGLAPVVRGARVVRKGDRLEVVATVAPARLVEVTSRLSRALGVAAAAGGSYPPSP